MKYSVHWYENRGGMPLLVNGKKEMVFDTYEEAKAFFDEELANTRYKRIDDLDREPSEEEYAKYSSQLELIMYDPQNPAICEDLEFAENYLVAGSDFGTGRPATGRTHAVSVRLTKEAFELLQRQRNKSEYIDRLIKEARSE